MICAVIAITLGILFLSFAFVLICFILVFYSPRRKASGSEEYKIPKGEIYEEYREVMTNWMREIRHAPHEKFEIKSSDGLTLCAKLYEYSADAPIEILFHGYRGNAERDMSGGVKRCHALGRSALIVDLRASGESDGRVITFGIRESDDLRLWTEFIAARYPERKIIIGGVSMGAATVMMALAKPLPEQVVCALADCGYTTPKAIISKVLRDIHLPVWLFYPAIKLGAKLFGRFDLEERSALEGAKNAKIPVIIIHGDTDDFVPCYMSDELYEACEAPHKKLFKVKGAGHGLAFPKDEEGYLSALREFEAEADFLYKN